jgi:hypothetical protein
MRRIPPQAARLALPCDVPTRPFRRQVPTLPDFLVDHSPAPIEHLGDTPGHTGTITGMDRPRERVCFISLVHHFLVDRSPPVDRMTVRVGRQKHDYSAHSYS